MTHWWLHLEVKLHRNASDVQLGSCLEFQNLVMQHVAPVVDSVYFFHHLRWVQLACPLWTKPFKSTFNQICFLWCSLQSVMPHVRSIWSRSSSMVFHLNKRALQWRSALGIKVPINHDTTWYNPFWQVWTSKQLPTFIWVNYNISLTGIKAIWGWFP